MLRYKTVYKPVAFRFKFSRSQAVKIVYKVKALSKILKKKYGERVSVRYVYHLGRIKGVIFRCTDTSQLNHIEMKYFIHHLQQKTNTTLFWSRVFKWREVYYQFEILWK